MPEELPTPAQSIQQVERAERARLERESRAERQPSLFGEGEGERGRCNRTRVLSGPEWP